ncbi:MAG: biopolymer transporter ExbD, partial [Alphaproteobacteria bacterium]
MAINVGSSGRKNGGRAYRPMAEINVTPFVDVMLVLLAIFMVTAPLLTVGVPVDLPKTNAASIAKPDEPLIVTVTAQGKVYL